MRRFRSSMIAAITKTLPTIVASMNTPSTADVTSTCGRLCAYANILFQKPAPRVSSQQTIIFWTTGEQKRPAVTREDALQLIQFLLQYAPPRSSKVNDFHRIWQGVHHFLLVINSNLGRISPFPRYGLFSVENAHFSYALHSTPNLKMFPCTRSLKFCTPNCKTQG